MKMRRGTRYYRRRVRVGGPAIVGYVSFPPRSGTVVVVAADGAHQTPLDELTPTSRKALQDEPVFRWDPENPDTDFISGGGV